MLQGLKVQKRKKTLVLLSLFFCVGLALLVPGLIIQAHIHKIEGFVMSATFVSFDVETNPKLCAEKEYIPFSSSSSSSPSSPSSSSFSSSSSSTFPSPSSPPSSSSQTWERAAMTALPNTTFFTNYKYSYQVEFEWGGTFYNLTACDTRNEVYCQKCPNLNRVKQIGHPSKTGPRRCPSFSRCSLQDFELVVPSENATRSLFISTFQSPPFVYFDNPDHLSNNLILSGSCFLGLGVFCLLWIFFQVQKKTKRTNETAVAFAPDFAFFVASKNYGSGSSLLMGVENLRYSESAKNSTPLLMPSRSEGEGEQDTAYGSD